MSNAIVLGENDVAVRVNSNSQQDVQKIHACISVLFARFNGERDCVAIDDIGSFSSHIAFVKGASVKGRNGASKSKRPNKAFDIMLKILSPYLKNYGLSDVQIKISALLLRGFSGDEVASELFMSDRNLSYHKREILRKMQLSNFRDYMAEIREVYESCFE